MPKTRYLTLEEALQRIFDEDSDDNEQNEADIVVIPPETAEASDVEEGNDNILNNDNDVLPSDTAGEIEVHVKKKIEPSKCSATHTRKLKKQKTEDLKWIKKEPLSMYVSAKK